MIWAKAVNTNGSFKEAKVNLEKTRRAEALPWLKSRVFHNSKPCQQNLRITIAVWDDGTKNLRGHQAMAGETLQIKKHI